MKLHTQRKEHCLLQAVIPVSRDSIVITDVSAAVEDSIGNYSSTATYNLGQVALSGGAIMASKTNDNVGNHPSKLSTPDTLNYDSGVKSSRYVRD